MPEKQPTSRHKATAEFWRLYRLLSPEIQSLASKNYELLKQDARHPSLQFKKVGKVWSIRVGLEHRALAVPVAEGYLWFWIGRHAEYDRILSG